MNVRIPWIAFVVLACLLAGCGGHSRSVSSGDGSSDPTRRVGSATFSIEWPRTTRLIPDDTQFVKVEIFDPQTPDQPSVERREDRVAVLVIRRPETTATAENLPLGNLYAVVQAFKEDPGVPTPLADPRAVTAEERARLNDPNFGPLAKATAAFATSAGVSPTVSFTMENAVAAIEPIPIENSSQTIRAIVLGRRSVDPTIRVRLRDAQGKTVLIDPRRLVWESRNNVATVDPGVTGHSDRGYDIFAEGVNLGVISPDPQAVLRVKYFALDADLANPTSERATLYADFQVPVTLTVGFGSLTIGGAPPPGTQSVRVEFFGNDFDPNDPNATRPLNGNVLYNLFDFSWRYSQPGRFQNAVNLDDLVPGRRRVVVTAWSGENAGTGFKLGSSVLTLVIAASGVLQATPDVPRTAIQIAGIENWVTKLTADVSPGAVISGLLSQLFLTITINEPGHPPLIQPISTQGFEVVDLQESADVDSPFVSSIEPNGTIHTEPTEQSGNVVVRVRARDPRWTGAAAAGATQAVLELVPNSAEGSITIK